MNKNIIIAFVIIVILLGGGVYVMSQPQNAVMEKKENEAVMEEEKMSSYTGTVIAGKSSPYIEFNKADYDAAVKSGKIIFLEFYANWCPVCRAQEPKLVEGFDALEGDDVVGFRVNYNDSETESPEKQLAKDFGVTYQHTHVILKDEKVVSKSNDDLDKDSFVTLVESVQ